MTRLEIPERAVDAALTENTAGLKSGEAMLVRLEAAAPIIVAAAYRARAQECNCLHDAELLKCAADELGPDGAS